MGVCVFLRKREKEKENEIGSFSNQVVMVTTQIQMKQEQTLPSHLIGEVIGQFLSRKEFDNLRLTSKEIHHATEQLSQPWPHVALPVGDTSIQSITFSTDGKKLSCRDRSGIIHVWDRSYGKQIKWIACSRSACLGNIVTSPDNTHLAFDGNSKSIQICKIESGKCIKILRGHEGAITSLSFSPDGKFIVSGSTDSTVRLWDLRSSECKQILRRHRGFVYSVDFSRNGRYLASAGSDRIIRVWRSLRTNQSDNFEQCLQLRGHKLVVVSVSFSPDNENLLASVSLDMTVRLWNIVLQSCTHCWKNQTELLNLCFSPNGRQLAAGRSDDTIALWNLEDEAKEMILNGRLLAFAPDGHTLAVGGMDGSVRLQRI